MDARELKYINYIKGKYPEMKVSKVECSFSDGKYSDIIILDGQDVFKFAKFDWSASHIDSEVEVMNLIKNHLSMNIPRADSLENGISRLSYIKGEPLFRSTLLQSPSRIQDIIAEQLGYFLKQLHSIPIKGQLSKVPEFSLNLLWEDWQAKYKEIERKVFPYCDSYSKEYYIRLFKPLLDNDRFLDFKPALIHGDLTPYHLIFNKEAGKLSGIIDFGLAGIGDPAYDVGILLDNLGEAFVKKVSRYYKNILYFYDRARFYAYFNSLLWARAVSDMIATRDFSNFRFYAKDRDIMPIGSKWLDSK